MIEYRIVIHKAATTLTRTYSKKCISFLNECFILYFECIHAGVYYITFFLFSSVGRVKPLYVVYVQIYLSITLLYAICVKDAREINLKRFNVAHDFIYVCYVCSCSQALLINNFQSDQKSHLIFVLSPLPAPSASVNCSSDMCMPRLFLPLLRCSSCRPIGLAGRQSFCYPCLLLSFHYCYFMHHIHTSSSSSSELLS